jgi:hypothetical protein
MIDKGITYKDRKGFFLGGGGADAADYDIGGGGNVANAPSTPSAPSGYTGGGGGRDSSQDDYKTPEYTEYSYDAPTGAIDDKFATGDPGTTGPGQSPDYTINTLDTLYNQGVGTVNIPPFVPGSTVINLGLNALSPFRNQMLRTNIDYFRGLEDIESKGYEKTEEGYRSYMMDRMSGKIDAGGNRINQTGRDDDSPFVKPITPITGMAAPIESGIASINTPYTFEDYIRSFQFYA